VNFVSKIFCLEKEQNNFANSVNLISGQPLSDKLKKTRVKNKTFNTCKYFYLLSLKKKMNTKLTLTIEQDVISKAKNYAKEKNRSLSNIIENYLKSLTREEDKAEIKLSPLIKSLKGSFKMPIDFDYKVELRKGLEDKYL
jgi:hypothetical protein